jgi:predicted dehydrogenase
MFLAWKSIPTLGLSYMVGLMSKVRFGYVGCGNLAQMVHHPNFKSLPECDFLALAEVRPQLLERVGKRLGVPRLYSSHLEMANDPDIEAVGISGGLSSQGELAIPFLSKGKAVFMEKPMATSVAQAKRMLQAAKDGGGRLMVGYMNRYDAGNQLAREWIREFKRTGDVGKATFIRMHGFGGDWIGALDVHVERTDEKAPESPLIAPDWLPAKWHGPYVNYLQQFTHNVNLTRWLLDSKVKPSVRTVQLEDDAYKGTVILDYDGIPCNLESGNVDSHLWDDHTQIYFEKGWVKRSTHPLLLRNVPCQVEVYRAKPKRELINPIPDPAWSWNYKREAQAFLKAVRSGEDFDSSGEDTLLDVELFEDIFRSWLTQRKEI